MNKLYFMLVTLILLGGCKQKTSNEDADFNQFVEKAKLVAPGVNKLSDIIYLIQLSGANYDSTVTNSTAQVENYKIHPLKAALNCGSYTADALYHRAFNNGEAAFESYTAAQILANHLEFGPFYVENLLKSRKEGIDEADSLWYKFDKVLQQVDSSLNQQERFQIKTAFLAGNMLKKLYLVNRIVSTIDIAQESNPEAYKLLYVLSHQEIALKSLIELIQTYDVATESEIFKEIQQLHQLYQGLKLDELTNYDQLKAFYNSELHLAISTQLNKIHTLIISN